MTYTSSNDVLRSIVIAMRDCFKELSRPEGGVTDEFAAACEAQLVEARAVIERIRNV